MSEIVVQQQDVCYLASNSRSSWTEHSGAVRTLADRENLSYSEGDIR